MKHHSINLDNHHGIDIDDLSTILRHAGYEVDWPVTGKLLLGGTEMNVDDILMQATDAYEAAERIIEYHERIIERHDEYEAAEAAARIIEYHDEMDDREQHFGHKLKDA